MFKTFINAFKLKEIRMKLLFTLIMLAVIRIGSQIPTPGMDHERIAEGLKTIFGDLGIFGAFTGGSFERMSILALNITPYITSSIVMELLTIAIPKLEEMQKEGEDGRKKIASITRYVTVGLALLESSAMAIGFNNSHYLSEPHFLNVLTVIAAMTAGSAFLMWIGERINEKGVGNGISIVLVINIISSFPEDAKALFEKFIKGKSIAVGVLTGAIMIAIIFAIIILVIYLSDATRKIPVQYAKKVQGSKIMGQNSSVIPIRVNTAGVIPVIFAASILQFPIIVSSLCRYNGKGFWQTILDICNQNKWCDFSREGIIYSIGLVIYIVLVIFFAYFYTSITFNPIEVANNLKKSGGFIPGIRPGKPTSEYLNGVLNYIIFIGACGLTLVCIIPIFFNGVFGAQVSFGGTSIIIVVSVVIETVKQIESQMLVRNYKGFLND